MAKKKIPTKPSIGSSSPYFCDTSIIFYKLHAHELHRQAVQAVRGSHPLHLPKFVRGEYIKGYIYGMIVLYTTVQAERDFKNGLDLFISDQQYQPRRIQNALNATTQIFGGYSSSEDFETSLERIGDYIQFCLYKLDDEFPTKHDDPLECEFGDIQYKQGTFDEGRLLELYAKIERIREKPACEQCTFRVKQMTELPAKGIDLHSVEQQKTYADHKGYVKQAKVLAKAEVSKLKSPSCNYCDRLGDSIIALQAPLKSVILTGDKQSYPALCDILGKNYQLIPSLGELSKAAKAKKK